MSSPSSTPQPTPEPARQSSRTRQLTERAKAALGSAAKKLTHKRRRGSQSSSEFSASELDDAIQRTQSVSTAAPSVAPPDDVDEASAPSAKEVLDKKAAFEKRFKTSTRTSERVLEKQMKLWKSGCYSHFETPPNIITDADNEVKYQFVCRSHPSQKVTRVRHDDGTSNLKRHVDHCEGKTVSSEANVMTLYASGCNYNAARHRACLVLWIARRRRPYAIVADPELLAIFTDLHAACKTPSQFTILCDVKDAHALVRDVVMKKLASVEGKVHISADGWTSPNTISFIGVVVQFVEGTTIKSFTLDYIKLTKSHTGVYLASKLAECIEAFGFENKIGSFTGDNASNNDTLVEELSDLIPAFRGDKVRVRCFAHVLNLVAKAILSPFAQKFESDDSAAAAVAEDLEEDTREAREDTSVELEADEVAPEVAASDAAAVTETEAEANLDGRLPELTSAEASFSRVALTKLSTVAYKIANSPTLIEALNEACDRARIKCRRLKKNVSTRWNSTSELARSGLLLRPALDKLVVMAEHNRPGTARLHRFQMDSNEWAILDQLAPLLDAVLLATTEVSQSKTPLMHDIIPLIDGLSSFCDSFIDDDALHPAVRHAALRGLHLLNKYYAHTDDTIVYRLAMILHPEYKLQYFTDAGWAPDWIAEARSLVTMEWTSRYRPVALSSAAEEVPESSSGNRFDRVRAHFQQHCCHDTTVDALEEYLNTPTIRLGTMDVITYWANAKASGHPLAQMVLDFLSVPATSTDVERAFSRGGLTVSKLCHSLSDESTRCSSVLGAWTEVPDLVPFNTLVAHFDGKKSRSNKKRRIEAEPTEVIDADE